MSEDPQKIEIKTKPKKIPIKIKSTEKTQDCNITIKPSKILLSPSQSWVEIFEHLPETLKMDEIIFERIWKQHPQNYAQGIMFGTEMEFPRWDQSYGQDYTYAGKIHKAIPIQDSYLLSIIGWVCLHFGKEYKSILINWYQDGNHYICPHTDSEKNIVNNSSIYSFSYGQERDFVIKLKDKTYTKKNYMRNGSFIIMGRNAKYYKHSVPKRALSTFQVAE